MGASSLNTDVAGHRGFRPLNLLITFIGFLDTPLLMPVVALYAASLRADVASVGIIVGVYSLTNTLANIVGGRLVDRYGYKRPLLAGLAGDALAMFAYSLCRTPWHLALVRAFHGTSGGLIGPATMSVMAQVSASRGLGRGMALYGIAIGGATLLGNAVGGLIGTRLGYQYVFYIGGALLAIAVVLAMLLRGGRPASGGEGRSSSLGLIETGRLLASRKLRLPYWSIFAQYFAFGGIVTLLPIRLHDLGLSAFHMGILIATFASVFIIVQFLGGHLSDVFGRIRPAAVGLALAAVGVAVLPLFDIMGLLLAAMACFGLGYGLFFPALSAALADGVSPGEYGRATGIYHALLTVGVAVGAPVMGRVAMYSGTEVGLALCAIPLFLAVVMAVGMLRQPRKRVGAA